MQLLVCYDIYLKEIMGKVLGMGNALVDILMQLESDAVLNELSLPKGSMQLVDGETANKVLQILGNGKSSKASGGSAANTIHGLANLGIETGFLGKIGRDSWGDFFRKDMEFKNISPLLLESDSDSGRAIALISPDSERTFATYLGAAVELSAADIPTDIFQGYAYFHVEGYLVQNRDLIRKALVKARKNGLKVSLDLASFNVVEDNLAFLREVVSDHVDILFANEEEARSFTGGLNNHEALDYMGKMAEITILKKGSEGSLIKHFDTVVKVGVVQAKPIDTTGAGDLYAAGFLYGLIKSLPLEKCGQLGALLSASVIEVIGPKMDEERWAVIKSEIERIIG
ncbi:sugar/nucleoside kinase (ribokinase family) [Natronoflexus pectinivorans]|uniref:Sugar/nucleoside kinase (Ribokinase family) n=2 Tax=Natronoflexus pectinivorans TaxID=682526 RepID=A0A4R2GIP4_9BACT|nr:sugar/nucleoside kinase (ribokinase family) [Natronoflexus pectinivorans]